MKSKKVFDSCPFTFGFFGFLIEVMNDESKEKYWSKN